MSNPLGEPLLVGSKRSSDADQSARLVEAARQLGADEDEDAFKAKLA